MRTEERGSSDDGHTHTRAHAEGLRSSAKPLRHKLVSKQPRCCVDADADVDDGMGLRRELGMHISLHMNEQRLMLHSPHVITHVFKITQVY